MERINDEGNTLGQEEDYCFGDFTVLVLILSLRKLRGFILYGFPEENLFVSLISCDVLMFYYCACYSLSEKILGS